MLDYNFYIKVDTKFGYDVFTNGSDNVLWGGDWYQVYPGVNRDIAKAWQKDDKFRWREVINGELWFTNRNADGALRSDYTLMSQINSTSVEVDIRIEQIAAGTTASDWWSGYYGINDGKWDNDRGVMIVTPAPDDNYRYLYAYGDKEVNMIGLSGGITARFEPDTSTVEICLPCQNTVVDEATEQQFRIDNPTFPADETGDPTDTWAKFGSCGDSIFDCGGSPACGGTDVSWTWQKQLSNIRLDDSYVWDEENESYYSPSCSPASTYISLNDRGIDLTDMIEALLSDIQTISGVALAYESTLFKNATNPVTGTNPNPLNGIIYYQKSDIKSTSDPATVGMMTFNELMDMIKNVWNAYWFIDSNGDFRIEHYKYFTKTVDTDLTTFESGKWVNAKYKYEYDREDMPSREHFEWMEASLEDFVGVDITYDKLATGNKFSDSQKDRLINATTDLIYAYSNESDISNEGWFILQTTGSDYTVGNESGLLTGDTIINGHMSWANLHDAYWKYGRVIENGNMNTSATVFSDYQKNIKQIEITYPVGASDFDPDKLKTTQIGDGEVGQAEYKLLDGTVTAVFFYPDLKDSSPPPAESYLVKTTNIWYVLTNIDRVKWYG